VQTIVVAWPISHTPGGELSVDESEHSQTGLPLRMDPTSGALIGIFLIGACLAGPIGLVLTVLAWILIYGSRRRRRNGGPQSSHGPLTGGDYAARSKANHSARREIPRSARLV
jgi:hypothetical protein